MALAALVLTFEDVLARTGTSRERVRSVGLDTPGPASATGVISSLGSTNFAHPGWRNFDFRGALEERLKLPVVYNNDGNAAALYAHYQLFGPLSQKRASISAIIGTGFGGGVIEKGQVIKGAAGFAGELGHVHIPLHGLLEPDQPLPQCNCGFTGDAESIASLTGIEKNLLPYWLSRHPGHELHKAGVGGEGREAGARARASRATRWRSPSSSSRRRPSGACSRSPPTSPIPTPTSWAAASSRRRPTSASGSSRRCASTRSSSRSRRAPPDFEVVPDLDMAGARGAAIAALETIRGE